MTIINDDHINRIECQVDTWHFVLVSVALKFRQFMITFLMTRLNTFDSIFYKNVNRKEHVGLIKIGIKIIFSNM